VEPEGLIETKVPMATKFQSKSSDGNLVPVEPEGPIETKVPIDGTESLNGTKWNKMEQNVPN